MILENRIFFNDIMPFTNVFSLEQNIILNNNNYLNIDGTLSPSFQSPRYFISFKGNSVKTPMVYHLFNKVIKTNAIPNINLFFNTPNIELPYFSDDLIEVTFTKNGIEEKLFETERKKFLNYEHIESDGGFFISYRPIIFVVIESLTFKKSNSSEELFWEIKLKEVLEEKPF